MTNNEFDVENAQKWNKQYLKFHITDCGMYTDIYMCVQSVVTQNSVCQCVAADASAFADVVEAVL